MQTHNTTQFIDLSCPLANSISVKNNILFFTKSCLSQWYGAYKGQEHKLEMPNHSFSRLDRSEPFEDEKYNGMWGFGTTKFNCAEQAMMFGKAYFFSDTASMDAILAAKDPRKQKELGRGVKNFDLKNWDTYKFKLVQVINKFKFRQNDDLTEFLLSTGHLIIAEAAPWDKIWGIGLGPDNPLAHNVKTWQGENLLGRSLMHVREYLKE